MPVVTIHEAKTKLSKLIARAEAGEEIVIARGKEPVVRLTPVVDKRPRPKFGAMKGKWPDLPDSFWFDPLPQDELKARFLFPSGMTSSALIAPDKRCCAAASSMLRRAIVT